MTTETGRSKPSRDARSRDQRLKAALRENLRRRKAQAQGRQARATLSALREQKGSKREDP